MKAHRALRVITSQAPDMYDGAKCSFTTIDRTERFFNGSWEEEDGGSLILRHWEQSRKRTNMILPRHVVLSLLLIVCFACVTSTSNKAVTQNDWRSEEHTSELQS